MGLLDFSGLFELIDVTQDNLDELWQQDDHAPYPQIRMLHLLEMLTSSFGSGVEKNIRRIDIWKDSYSDVKESLSSGIQLCQKWSQVCSTLTSQLWKNFPLHAWNGDGFVPKRLASFAIRLEEVRHFL